MPCTINQALLGANIGEPMAFEPRGVHLQINSVSHFLWDCFLLEHFPDKHHCLVSTHYLSLYFTLPIKLEIEKKGKLIREGSWLQLPVSIHCCAEAFNSSQLHQKKKTFRKLLSLEGQDQ